MRSRSQPAYPNRHSYPYLSMADPDLNPNCQVSESQLEGRMAARRAAARGRGGAA